MEDLQSITKALLDFRDARDWKQFHNAKDLALAINIESSELVELFLWKNPDEVITEKIKDELADILSFALLLAHERKIDVFQAVQEKIQQNEIKYPVEKSKGSSKKYNEL